MRRLHAGKLSTLECPGSRGVQEDGKAIDPAFIVRREDGVFGFINQCPHTAVNLDWQPDQFLDMDGLYIQCSVHGALFQIEDGVCVRGPCPGQQLQTLPVHIDGDDIYVDLP